MLLGVESRATRDAFRLREVSGQPCQKGRRGCPQALENARQPIAYAMLKAIMTTDCLSRDELLQRYAAPCASFAYPGDRPGTQ